MTTVRGCKNPKCKVIYMLCWICGYCSDHCTCLDTPDPGEEPESEIDLSKV